MKASYLFVVALCFALASCSSINAEQPTNSQAQNAVKNTPPIQKCKKKKNPMDVSFYTREMIPPSYKVVGKASVSQYNAGGSKRAEAMIHDAMGNVAASMGGDAIINIKRNDKIVTGTVIAYQPAVSV